MHTFISFKLSVAMYHVFIDVYYDIIKNSRIYEVQCFRSIQYMILLFNIYVYIHIIIFRVNLTKKVSDFR